MSKKLNEETIFNELKQGSSFFRSPEPISPQTSQVVETNNQINKNRTEYPSVLPDDRTVVRKSIRRTVRHPFEIYEDQLDDLRRLKAMLVLDGAPSVSMSEMVREALDNFIKKEKSS